MPSICAPSRQGFPGTLNSSTVGKDDVLRAQLARPLPKAPMRRWVAVLLLVVVATFLAASGIDRCDDGPNPHSQASQHLLCLDDCTPALIPCAPAAPPPDALPTPSYALTVARAILDLDLEPETTPPRT